jgi:hypothetical protein
VASAEPPAQATGNPFHGLFRNTRTSPVSDAVARAWLPLAGKPVRTAQAAGAAPAQMRAGAIGVPLDLLSFIRVRG